ncbi:MAG TPA: hypothetical protein VKH15_15955 [Candidatus Acidoferrum sp.]|nr:hypothetical protein [Candidatus Acidoferrum sp.]
MGEETGAHFGHVFVRGFDGMSLALGFQHFLHARESAKQQLGKISEGNGVLAVDALVGELFGDVGKKCVDFAGRGEAASLTEKMGGEDFRIGPCGSGLLQVIRAKRIVMRGAKHAAALAAGTDVVAMQFRIMMFRHVVFLSK